MNTLPRCILWAFATQTLLFGACAARPDLAERLDLNVWTIPEKQRQVSQAQLDMDRDDVRLHEGFVRLETRERTADAVAAGQIGLIEAAARFRELNATALPSTMTLRDCFPGDSEEERCCRQVIAWVKVHLTQKSATEAERVAQRLEEELSEQLRSAASRG